MSAEDWEWKVTDVTGLTGRCEAEHRRDLCRWRVGGFGLSSQRSKLTCWGRTQDYITWVKPSFGDLPEFVLSFQNIQRVQSAATRLPAGPETLHPPWFLHHQQGSKYQIPACVCVCVESLTWRPLEFGFFHCNTKTKSGWVVLIWKQEKQKRAAESRKTRRVWRYWRLAHSWICRQENHDLMTREKQPGRLKNIMWLPEWTSPLFIHWLQDVAAACRRFNMEQKAAVLQNTAAGKQTESGSGQTSIKWKNCVSAPQLSENCVKEWNACWCVWVYFKSS